MPVSVRNCFVYNDSNDSKLPVICTAVCVNRRVVVCVLQLNLNLAVANIGAPACGMNAAARSFVRLALTRGFSVLGIHFGLDGLLKDQVSDSLVLVCVLLLLTSCSPV